MVKKICLISLIVLCAGVGFFYQTIQLAVMKRAVDVYSMHYFGSPLKFRRAYLNRNQLILQSVRLGDQQFAADEVAIHFRLDIWNRELDLSIALDRPSLRLQDKAAKEWQKWQSLVAHEKPWFHIHPSLQVKEGSLTWTLPDERLLHALRFDLDLNSRSGGYVKAYLTEGEPNSHFIVDAFSTPESMLVRWEGQEVDCPSLAAFAKLFISELTAWDLASGRLNGKLEAIFAAHERPYLRGDLVVNDLAFSQQGSSLAGKIEQAKLSLEKNAHLSEPGQALTTIGQLEIVKPASLAYQIGSQDEWIVDGLLGSIAINGSKKAAINLNAEGRYLQQSTHFNLLGLANLNALDSLNLNLNLSCSSLGQAKGEMHVFLHQLKEGSREIEVQLKHLSYIECGFLQRMLAISWPQIKEVELQSGLFDASLVASLTNKGLEAIHFKQFKADGLEFKLCAFNTNCSLKQARGQGSINLNAPDIWRSVDTELHIDDGHVQANGLDPNVPLTAIQTHLKIEQGNIPHALVALEFAGLKGAMDIEWGEGKELITVKLNGESKDIAGFLPDCLQEGLKNHFERHQLHVLANIKKSVEQLELVGAITIWQDKPEQAHLIHFGGELKKIAESPEKVFIPVGWFYARELPLEKFVSPFIFRKGILNMRGKTEIKGSFDNLMVMVKYDAEDLRIENEDLLIEVKDLRSTVPGQLLGFHQFNLKTGAHQGTLPIQQASYFEKNSGLHFSDIQGKILFKDQALHIRSMEAYCQEVYFAGSLDLDYSDPAPGFFSLKIKSPTFAGKVSKIQYMLSHIDPPSSLNRIQLEGEVNGKEQGMTLSFNFFPGDYHLQAAVKGVLLNGFLPVESGDMSLKGLFADIDYHHSGKCLTFSDIQGTLLVGKPHRVQEYAFWGDHVCFKGIENPSINLDIGIKDKEDELMRLVAETKELGGGDQEILVNTSLTHISQVYPSQFKCRIGQDSRLQALDYGSQFELQAITKDLLRFKQTGLLSFSPSMLAKLEQFGPIVGGMSLNIHYDPIEKCYDYSLKSDGIRLSSAVPHVCLLKGKKRDKRWIIDQFQWDELNCFADLHQSADKWRLNFLGLNDGDSLIMGLEGDILPEKGELQSKINLCELNLARLKKWPFLQEFAAKWDLKGNLQLKGPLTLSLLPDSPGFQLQGHLTADVQELSVRNCPCDVIHPFQISIQTGQQLAIDELIVQLYKPSDPASHWGQLLFQGLQFNWQNKSLQCPLLAFNFPSQHLADLSAAMHLSFPDLMDEGCRDIFSQLKKEGALSGMLEIQKDFDHQDIALSLDEGIYFFKNRSYDLTNFHLKVKDQQLSFSAHTYQERCPFQIKGKADWPVLRQGEYTLLDFTTIQERTSPPLTVKWQRHPQKGFIIDHVKGSFNGMDFNLESQAVADSAPDWTALHGTVDVDFNLLCPLASSSLAESIQKLKVGSTFQLKGFYWMNPTIGPSLLETVFFQGTLACRQGILKGYVIDCLDAELNYQPKRLDIADLTIQDQAGFIHSPQLVAVEEPEKGDWLLFMPRLTVKNLKPSLLRDAEEESPSLPSKFKTLLIRRIDLEDFYGSLGDRQTWRGNGRFHFLNLARKNPSHPLLAIPAEIILRLGLDPHVLNPVTGTVYFNLQGYHFYLTRFKDVYSEGRGSKFYLAHSAVPSWMDMDGNLSVQIRMKQYNLIFKIAELFTVSVQGNLRKPKYTLQKQAKNSRKLMGALLDH